MATDNLYVDAFDESTKNWNTHFGANPYLQAAAGNEISAFTDHVVDAIFGFANTSGAYVFADITSIKLRGQVASSNEDHYAVAYLYGSSGGAWNISRNILAVAADSVYYPFTSTDLKATISSLARIDECLMTLTKHNVGAGTFGLKQVFLEVTYTVAGAMKKRMLVGVGL